MAEGPQQMEVRQQGRRGRHTWRMERSAGSAAKRVASLPSGTGSLPDATHVAGPAANGHAAPTTTGLGVLEPQPAPAHRAKPARRRSPRHLALVLAGALAAVIATLPAWLPWLDPRQNLWEVHDAENHLLRLYTLRWMIEQGVWYPRWLPALYLGYGYPLFNYYAPGFYYLALALGAALHLDLWDAYRAAGAAAALVGATGVYALVWTIWRRAALGIAAAVALLYGPYVFQTNLFIRGDLPEALTLALLPWLLLAIWRCWFARTPRAQALWTAVLAALGTAIVLTHNITPLLFLPLAGLWALFLLRVRPDRHALARLTAAALLAAGLTSFFWLPAFLERDAVQLDRAVTGNTDYREWLLDLGGSTPKQQAPENHQTRAGPIDLHLHYAHGLIAAPKVSLAQASLVALAVLSLAAAAVARRVRAGRRRTSSPRAASAVVLAGARWNAHAGGSWPLWPSGEQAAIRLPPRDGAAGRGSWLPRSAGEQAAAALASLPLLAAAAACWALTFTFSEPVWAAVPGMALIQFPWRLMGPLGVCVAVAGTGALALPLHALQARWPRAGRLSEYGLAALVVVAFIFNGLGQRGVQLADAPARTIDGRLLVDDETQRPLAAGTTSGLEFLPRAVDIAPYSPGQVRHVGVMNRLFPEGEWLGGLFYPLDGSLQVLGWRNGPLWLSARVANSAGDAAGLAVHQLRFPGWRAWIDGRPAPVETVAAVPEQHASAGFMVVHVPPGEHTVTLAFGSTPARIAGMLITLLTALAGVGLLASQLRAGVLASEPGESKGVWPGRLAAAALGGGLAVVAGLCLRGLAPAIPGAWTLAAARSAEARDGVWSAPHLGRHEGTLLVDIAQAVRAAQARIDSPTGATLGPGSFVDVRTLTITDEAEPNRGWTATSSREWLYEHPPSAVAVDLALPARRETWFEATIALDPAVWRSPTGDGMRFLVTVAPLAPNGEPGPETVVLGRDLNPRSFNEERRWVPVAADLSPWGGSTVRLTLRTFPRNDLTYDWGGWGTPIVVVRESARAHAQLAGQNAQT